MADGDAEPEAIVTVYSGNVELENSMGVLGGTGVDLAPGPHWVEAYLTLDSAGALHLYADDESTEKLMAWELGEESDVAPSDVRKNCLIVHHVRVAMRREEPRRASVRHGAMANGRTGIEFRTARFMSTLGWVKAIEKVLDSVLDGVAPLRPRTDSYDPYSPGGTPRGASKATTPRSPLAPAPPLAVSPRSAQPRTRAASSPAARSTSLRRGVLAKRGVLSGRACPASPRTAPPSVTAVEPGPPTASPLAAERSGGVVAVMRKPAAAGRRSPGKSKSARLPSMSVVAGVVHRPGDIWVQLPDAARGRSYYCNQRTKDVSWTAPPAGAELWVQYADPVRGTVFYGNVATGETSWLPPGATSSPASAAAALAAAAASATALSAGAENAGLLASPAASAAVAERRRTPRALSISGRSILSEAISPSPSPSPRGSVNRSSSVSAPTSGRSSLASRSRTSTLGSPRVAGEMGSGPAAGPASRSPLNRRMASQSSGDVLASPTSPRASLLPRCRTHAAIAPETWQQYTDAASGRVYWGNARSGETTWTDPTFVARPPATRAEAGVTAVVPAPLPASAPAPAVASPRTSLVRRASRNSARAAAASSPAASPRSSLARRASRNCSLAHASRGSIEAAAGGIEGIAEDDGTAAASVARDAAAEPSVAPRGGLGPGGRERVKKRRTATAQEDFAHRRGSELFRLAHMDLGKS